MHRANVVSRFWIQFWKCVSIVKEQRNILNVILHDWKVFSSTWETNKRNIEALWHLKCYIYIIYGKQTFHKHMLDVILRQSTHCLFTIDIIDTLTLIFVCRAWQKKQCYFSKHLFLHTDDVVIFLINTHHVQRYNVVIHSTFM